MSTGAGVRLDTQVYYIVLAIQVGLLKDVLPVSIRSTTRLLHNVPDMYSAMRS